jgi:hypothetical protein
MNIKDFLQRFGTSSTTNFELIRFAKELKIPNFHCVMRNELKLLRKLKQLPVHVICNYQTTDDSGTHWVAMFKDNKNSFYFDSYGIDLFTEAKLFLVHGIYSTFRIQPNDSQMCGSLSIRPLFIT